MQAWARVSAAAPHTERQPGAQAAPGCSFGTSLRKAAAPRRCRPRGCTAAGRCRPAPGVLPGSSRTFPCWSCHPAAGASPPALPSPDRLHRQASEQPRGPAPRPRSGRAASSLERCFQPHRRRCNLRSRCRLPVGGRCRALAPHSDQAPAEAQQRPTGRSSNSPPAQRPSLPEPGRASPRPGPRSGRGGAAQTPCRRRLSMRSRFGNTTLQGCSLSHSGRPGRGKPRTQGPAPTRTGPWAEHAMAARQCRRPGTTLRRAPECLQGPPGNAPSHVTSGCERARLPPAASRWPPLSDSRQERARQSAGWTENESVTEAAAVGQGRGRSPSHFSPRPGLLGIAAPLLVAADGPWQSAGLPGATWRRTNPRVAFPITPTPVIDSGPGPSRDCQDGDRLELPILARFLKHQPSRLASCGVLTPSSRAQTPGAWPRTEGSSRGSSANESQPRRLSRDPVSRDKLSEAPCQHFHRSAYAPCSALMPRTSSAVELADAHTAQPSTTLREPRRKTAPSLIPSSASRWKPCLGAGGCSGGARPLPRSSGLAQLRCHLQCWRLDRRDNLPATHARRGIEDRL